MSTWKVTVVLHDCTRTDVPPITLVSEDALSDTLLVKLCEAQARFEHEGKKYYCSRPYVDPLKKTLTYKAETYDR